MFLGIGYSRHDSILVVVVVVVVAFIIIIVGSRTGSLDTVAKLVPSHAGIVRKFQFFGRV